VKIKRRKTKQVRIGKVKIGGTAPISIQSMAKTETKNIRSTVKEIKRLEKSGCEIVRVAVKDLKDAVAIAQIKKRIKIPIVADIHFNFKLAIRAIESKADAIRLNPGNIYREKEIREIIKHAKRARIPIRIGANSGSLRDNSKGLSEEGRMVKSVLGYIKYFQQERFRDIIISLKSSNVLSTIAAYKKMAALCDYPLHLGITATGIKEDGIIKSAVGIGALLSEGIGDTIRVSLTSDPVDEVYAAKTILQSLRLRSFGPEIISCPTCGRCKADIEGVVKELKDKLNAKRYTLNAKHPITIAVMGCEVNGPGEAKNAYIGIAAGKGSGVIFKKGKVIKRVKKRDFTKEIIKNL